MKQWKQHIALKSIGGIVLLLVIFCGIIGVIGFNSFTDAMLSQYAEGAFLTAETAKQLVDADRLEAYAQSGGVTEEYRSLWEQLDQLCNSSGSTFIYVIQPDRSDYAHITFIFSTINHESTYSVYEFGFVRNTTNDDYRQKYRALYELEADRELVIRNIGYIETDPHITAMVGLKGSDGQVKALLCVQRQMDVLVHARQGYINKILLMLIALVACVIVGQSLFLHKTLLLPIKKISKEATRFSEENVASVKKLKDRIRSEDEIGQLAASIDHMEEKIQHYVESITRITAEKERINTELSLAARIQADMLPHDFPPFPERREFNLFASMDPAKEVGGDFYDFFLVDDDHLCLLIADVSGKGIPAALFMMATRILLKNTAMLGESPAKVLTDVNNAVCANNKEEMFVTVWLGLLEISTGRLTAVNAGHEYPALRQPGGQYALLRDKHGFVVGGMKGISYRQYDLALTPGTKLFVYTDGVPEATNGQNELFGPERMLAALNEQPDASVEQTLEAVQQAVDRFVLDAPQFDDLTMLCLEYLGPGG